MPVTIKTNSGGGSVTLDAGTGSLDTTLTLPNTSGTILSSGTTITVAQGGTGLTSPGANGNVLTSNGTAWTSAAPAAGSLTLLATLTTTSGTTQSATGLPTTYANLICVCVGVGNSTGGNTLLLAASVDNGANYGTALGGVSSSPISGPITIYRANSSSTIHPLGPDTSGSAYRDLVTLSAAPINALRFSWFSGYTFNAGTIYIYGWN